MNADDHPMNERCGAALGLEVHHECWTLNRMTMSGPEHIQIGGCRRGNPEGCRPDMPPFGENTPRGWACTGPLIERFRLDIAMGRFPSGPEWRVVPYPGRDDDRTVWAPHICAAVAEWVSQFVRDGKAI